MSVGAGSIRRAAKAAGKSEEGKEAAATVNPQETAEAKTEGTAETKTEETKKTKRKETKQTAGKTAATGMKKPSAKTKGTNSVRKVQDANPEVKQEKRYGIGEELPIYLM